VQLRNGGWEWGIESHKKSATILAHCFNCLGCHAYWQGHGVNVIFLDIVIRYLVGKGKQRSDCFI
jgi:hypothetical protein